MNLQIKIAKCFLFLAVFEAVKHEINTEFTRLKQTK